MVDFKISDDAFKYLVIQHGSVSDKRHDRQEWERAYVESIERLFTHIRPFLPEKATSIVDIGGGLSGISVLLSRHYRGRVHFLIVDGTDEEPVVVRHSRPFSNAAVAKRFLKANGVTKVEFMEPATAQMLSWNDREFDLAVSFASYCFHYPPTEYLALASSAKVKIFDVRHRYRESAMECFGNGQMLGMSTKFGRYVWRG